MLLTEKDAYSDDLKNSNWLGEVISNEDSEKLGRIKIKVFGKFDNLTEEIIPWARPSNGFSAGSNSGSGSYSVPKVGSIVNVVFDNGNIYAPMYTYIEKPSDELMTEIGSDIINFHSLVYDTEIEGGLKIFYSQNGEKGLFINLNNTLINIRNDNELIIKNPNGDLVSLKNDGTLNIQNSASITIQTKSTVINSDDELTVNAKSVNLNADSVNLGKSASESVIKGDTFKQVFDTHVHTGNIGSPTSPPIIKVPSNALSEISKTK